MTVSHVELARLLVDSEHGADVSAKNQGGVDSAASGVVRRSFKTLQFLVEHGANSDVSIKDNLKDGSTPPHRAFKLQVQVVMRSCGTCAVEFLVETASTCPSQRMSTKNKDGSIPPHPSRPRFATWV